MSNGLGYEVVVYSLALTVLLTGVHSDICRNTTPDELESHVSSGFPPKDGVDAGKYTKITGVENFGECVKACCEEPACNAAFFSQGSCLNIECKTDDGCSPAKRLRSIAGAVLVNVRTVAETTLMTTEAPAHYSNITGEGEVATTTQSQVDKQFNIVTCEFGLYECPSNEECRVAKGDKRRSNGICGCKEGYTRQSTSGPCIQSRTVQTAAPDEGNKDTPTTAAPSTTSTTTAKDHKTSKPGIVPLTVSAGDSKVLKYPEDSTKLTAYVIPQPQAGETYSYHWSLIHTPEGDDIGQTSGIDSSTLLLTKLVPGLYVLSVEVKGNNKQGSAIVNVTVGEEPKTNEPPVAVIKPPLLNIKEGTSGILDGADSTDDDEIKSYLWEVVSAPITDEFKLANDKTSMLRLKGLSHGKYLIRLTVTDAAGLKNSTTATVNVEEEADYPPTANAGDDIMVNLPKNYVTLMGNASTDDKGIASYEWQAKDTDSTTDIEGVHEPFLRLKHLTEGVYTFELKVTDTKGQTSSDEVRVYVQTSPNKPPVAVVERNYTSTKPGEVVLLDGSGSTDDQKIVKYQWKQVSGPNNAKMDNGDRAKASVENLVEGDYVFKLTVSDAEDLYSSASVEVKVQTVDSERPVAKAGKDRTVTLPIDILRVDGSQSRVSDGQITYKWTKGDDSPGAGSIVNGTDTAPVLLVSNIVPGTYIFTLEVTDNKERHDSSSVTINVEEDPQVMNLVEISLDTSIESFTEKHKKDLATQLVLILPSATAAAQTQVEITGVYTDYHNGKLTLLFLVKDYSSSYQFTVRNGTLVKHQLKEKLEKDSELIGFNVAQVDTVVCQNECSGHGYCDQFSKECVCEPFWMPNYARATWEGESNCDWSILYVVVITMASIIMMSVLIWLCVCCTRRCSFQYDPDNRFDFDNRCKRSRGKRKKHTYKLLPEEQLEIEDALAKKRRSNITAGSGSIFLSETDDSSEEDTLFANGHNGSGNNFNRSTDNLVKTNNYNNKLRA